MPTSHRQRIQVSTNRQSISSGDVAAGAGAFWSWGWQRHQAHAASASLYD